MMIRASEPPMKQRRPWGDFVHTCGVTSFFTIEMAFPEQRRVGRIHTVRYDLYLTV
jgi:hypothetical protein